MPKQSAELSHDGPYAREVLPPFLNRCWGKTLRSDGALDRSLVGSEPAFSACYTWPMTILGTGFNRLTLGLGFLTVMIPGVVYAAEFRADVFRVIDGDTLEVRHHGRSERIRVEGIDCPELKQPYGKEAKRAVMALVIGSPVTLKTYGRSHDGALRADVFLQNGRRLSQILLEEGLAWKVATTGSSGGDGEGEARYAKRGLWADPNPTPPWKFRAAQVRKRR